MCLNTHLTKADNIQAAQFVPNYLCRKKFPGLIQSMNQLFRSPAKTQAFRVWIPPRDTIPCFDQTLFPFKSALVFTCFLFCKTNNIFLISILHTINKAKQNWIRKIRSPYHQMGMEMWKPWLRWTIGDIQRQKWQSLRAFQPKVRLRCSPSLANRLDPTPKK